MVNKINYFLKNRLRGFLESLRSIDKARGLALFRVSRPQQSRETAEKQAVQKAKHTTHSPAQEADMNKVFE